LTPKTICEGLCGPVHVNALFGHANALFGGCRVPVEFPLSCRVVEARAQCMVSPDLSSRPTRESGTSGAPRSNELATRPRPSRTLYSPRVTLRLDP
jgi:hypothetical protein